MSGQQHMQRRSREGKPEHEAQLAPATDAFPQEFASSIIGRIGYAIFHWRLPLLVLGVLATLVLAVSASHLSAHAGFTKMIPLNHEYMKTFLEYQNDFGGADKVVIAVSSRNGEIFQRDQLDVVKKITEDVFYIKGIERSSLTSLFTPNVRYNEVVEEGFKSGNLVPADYAGRDDQIAQVRANTLRSDWVGRIVSSDMTSAMVVATLQGDDSETGKKLDLQKVADQLEAVRAKYEGDLVTVHIIGFTKAIGDIAKGATHVVVFFGVAFVITALLLYWYSGSFMLTAWALIAALVPVIWLLGLLPVFGLDLDPMSMLVPFLIFSIGVSHAVQMTSAWKLETLGGADGVTASRNCFMKLFIPGAMALLANAIGFIVIAFVDIGIVRELALTATIGVSVMIITNKVLLPILLSYMKISASSARKLRGMETAGDSVWGRIGPIATRRGAIAPLAIAAILLAVGYGIARNLKIGDLGHGVPELQPHSRYNQDVKVITQKFATGIDQLVVIVEDKHQDSPCIDRSVIEKVEALEYGLRQVDGVAAVRSIAGFVKAVTQDFAEAFVKWRMLPEDRAQIAQGVGFSTRLGTEFRNSNCTAMPVTISTVDHQAATITHIVDYIKQFAAENGTKDLQFRLASGNVGVMAATNEVIERSDLWVNLALFSSVGLLCLVTFRSWRVTLCIILPLALVTILCKAIMVMLGIGLKVNTLPVVALGVGVGVDYGIYLFERMKHEMHERNHSLQVAFVEALKQRGTASVFTAITMTVSVASWLLSPLKFQADMGLLLAFMFLVNVLGAILLTPALAAYLVGNRLQQHDQSCVDRAETAPLLP